jgi:hypothetical protein
MSVERGVTEATVRIRTPRMGWMPLLVVGLVVLAMRASLEWVVPAGPSPGGSWSSGDNAPLVMGGVFVLESLLIRSFGIDLTPESANVRGFRRRRVPWSQIQAVLGFRQMGADRVALVLDSGERVVLRMPATYLGSGAATDVKYREDFHRLGQWWLAHRGPSWHPVRPEAPGAPIPE